MDSFKHLVEFVPFLITTADKRYHLNYADITKTVIIGIITGLLSAYVTVQRLDVRMNEVEKKIERFQKDFYKPRGE